MSEIMKLTQLSFSLSLSLYILLFSKGPLAPWTLSYGSWIYNYLCNRCLSPLILWVRSRSERCVQHYVIKFVGNLGELGRWFSPSTPVSSTNKTDLHGYNWNIIESGVKHHKTKSNLFSQAHLSSVHLRNEDKEGRKAKEKERRMSDISQENFIQKSQKCGLSPLDLLD